jgi:hypothetical protein
MWFANGDVLFGQSQIVLNALDTLHAAVLWSTLFFGWLISPVLSACNFRFSRYFAFCDLLVCVDGISGYISMGSKVRDGFFKQKFWFIGVFGIAGLLSIYLTAANVPLMKIALIHSARAIALTISVSFYIFFYGWSSS